MTTAYHVALVVALLVMDVILLREVVASIRRCWKRSALTRQALAEIDRVRAEIQRIAS
jgi:hypothetical protein